MGENKETIALIEDLRAVFKKHDVYIEVNDNYDGCDDWCGKSMEISSLEFVDDMLPICISCVEDLERLINNNF